MPKQPPIDNDHVALGATKFSAEDISASRHRKVHSAMSEPPDNVVIWRGVTKHDLSPERVLDAAKEAGLSNVVILGWLEGEPYFASSLADGGAVMWLMEKCKAALLAAWIK